MHEYINPQNSFPSSRTGILISELMPAYLVHNLETRWWKCGTICAISGYCFDSR